LPLWLTSTTWSPGPSMASDSRQHMLLDPSRRSRRASAKPWLILIGVLPWKRSIVP
jgi:hypothetical protein